MSRSPCAHLNPTGASRVLASSHREVSWTDPVRGAGSGIRDRNTGCRAGTTLGALPPPDLEVRSLAVLGGAFPGAAPVRRTQSRERPPKPISCQKLTHGSFGVLGTPNLARFEPGRSQVSRVQLILDHLGRLPGSRSSPR